VVVEVGDCWLLVLVECKWAVGRGSSVAVVVNIHGTVAEKFLRNPGEKKNVPGSGCKNNKRLITQHKALNAATNHETGRTSCFPQESSLQRK
jgi:hypothetical protein